MGDLWREDIDALQFSVDGNASCMVHRLAFRALTGMREPQAEDCLRFFAEHRADFLLAAQEKISRTGGRGAGNFHLTSRDVQGASGKSQTIKD